jgi:hypothetical protein
MPADQQTVHWQAEANSESHAISSFVLHIHTGSFIGFLASFPALSPMRHAHALGSNPAGR